MVVVIIIIIIIITKNNNNNNNKNHKQVAVGLDTGAAEVSANLCSNNVTYIWYEWLWLVFFLRCEWFILKGD